MTHQLRKNSDYPILVNPSDVVCGFIMFPNLANDLVPWYLKPNDILKQSLGKFWNIVIVHNPDILIYNFFRDKFDLSDQLKECMEDLQEENVFNGNTIVIGNKNLSVLGTEIIDQRVLFGFCYKSQNPEIITIEKDDHVKSSVEPLSEKSSNCFIATALYGEQSFEVQILRHYRDIYLLNNHFGKLFTDFYYNFAPSVSKVIKKFKLLAIPVEKIISYIIIPTVKNKINKENIKK